MQYFCNAGIAVFAYYFPESIILTLPQEEPMPSSSQYSELFVRIWKY